MEIKRKPFGYTLGENISELYKYPFRTFSIYAAEYITNSQNPTGILLKLFPNCLYTSKTYRMFVLFPNTPNIYRA